MVHILSADIYSRPLNIITMFSEPYIQGAHLIKMAFSAASESSRGYSLVGRVALLSLGVSLLFPIVNSIIYIGIRAFGPSSKPKFKFEPDKYQMGQDGNGDEYAEVNGEFATCKILHTDILKCDYLKFRGESFNYWGFIGALLAQNSIVYPLHGTSIIDKELAIICPKLGITPDEFKEIWDIPYQVTSRIISLTEKIDGIALTIARDSQRNDLSEDVDTYVLIRDLTNQIKYNERVKNLFRLIVFKSKNSEELIKAFKEVGLSAKEEKDLDFNKDLQKLENPPPQA